MRAFTDFEYYQDTYKGKLSKDEYNSKSYTAFTEIQYQTDGKALGAPTIMEDQVKMCECSLIDSIAEIEEIAGLSGVVSSINNDGYSITYAGVRGRDKNDLIKKVAKNLCYRLLTTPFNLMYRGL